MSKKLYYLSINNDHSLTMDAYILYNRKEFLLSLENTLKCPERYFKILNEKDDRIFIFSVPVFIQKHSKEPFEKIISEVRKYIQDIPSSDIFLFWIKTWDNPILLKEILKKYPDINILYDDLKESYDRFHLFFKDDVKRIKEKYVKIMDRIEIILQNKCDDIQPFQIKKIKISCPIILDHSLYYYLDHLQLSYEWNLSHYQDFIRWDPRYPLDYKEEEYEYKKECLSVFHKNDDDIIELYADRIELDMHPNKIENSREEILKIFPGFDIQEYKQIALSGFFYYKNAIYHKLIWQDYCMNDPIASEYIYINELEKATKYGENVYIHFENIITAIMINRENDIYPKTSEMITSNENYIRINIVRAPNEKEIHRFQIILCSLLNRFYKLYPEYILDYEKYISIPPLFQDKTGQSTSDISNFRMKYKHILKNIGYTITCRPKDRIPKIISKEESKKIDPLYKIIYPKKENDELAIDIPKEYLTCPSQDYIYPGIISLSGGNIYVPCCFNKNQRSSKSFTEYYSEKKTEIKASEHIKSENQIIKTFGDYGKLPIQISNFLTMIFPLEGFLRCGTIDSENSILYSLSYLCEQDDKNIKTKFIDDVKKYLSLGRQENPFLTDNDIYNDLKSDKYMDPRKYIRYLEEYYNVNIVLFSKSKKTEEIEILIPNHSESYLRFYWNEKRPFVFLYEHWGSSPDRYTKRLFPVCEMIVSINDDLKLKRRRYKLNHSQYNDFEKIYEYLFRYYKIKSYHIVSFYPIIKKQWIDHHGKVRGFYVKYYNDLIYLEPNDIYPPLKIKDEIPSLPKTDKSDIGRIKEFCKEFKMDFVNIYHYDNEYFVKLKDKFGYIYHVLINPPPPNEKAIILCHSVPIFNTLRKNILREEIYNERLARVICDYVLWLYSRFPKNMNDFFRDHITYIPGHIYDHDISEDFDCNPSIYKNDKIYIHSEILYDKFRFMIEYYQHNHDKELENYKSLMFMPNYYKKPTDFLHQHEIYTIDVYERIMSYRGNIVLDTISLSELTKSSGYWYKYDEMPLNYDNPFIYREMLSEKEAVSLSIFWKKYHYIPDYPIQFDDPLVNIGKYHDNKWDFASEHKEFIVFLVYTTPSKFYLLLPI